MWVWINEEWTPEEEAKVSVFDRGFLYGDGVFETMRAYGGQVFRLDAHLKRLEGSAAAIRLQVPRSAAEIAEDVRRLLERNCLEDAVVRVTLSRGPGPRGPSIRQAGPPTYVVSTHAVPEARDDGLRLRVVGVRRAPSSALPSHAKHANYLNSILAREEAESAGFDDALMLSEAGWLAESSGANLFWVARGRLYTPAEDIGLLPGIARRVIMERMAVSEAFEPPGVLDEADEIFTTNSVLGVTPVAGVDGRMFEPGGPMTIRARQEYARAVFEDTGADTTRLPKK